MCHSSLLSCEHGGNRTHCDIYFLTPQAEEPASTSQPKSILWSVCPYILANEFCERLAYYGYEGVRFT